MTRTLSVDIRKEFSPNGPVVVGKLTQPTDQFSVTVLFGPSGCGKTTILRCLAGLVRPEQGRIEFDDEVWFDGAKNVYRSPQQRDIGFLFQDYSLFPHLTVFENIVFGLKRHPPEVIRQTCSDLLSRFDLRELAGRYPHQISGGQQQRVALARVLARRPRLLLLDEPLSALDSNLRDELRGQLRRLLTDFGIPVVLVTHDRTEAIALGDWIAVMEAGHIHQFGTVRDVFTHPAGLNVARIVGVETIVPGEIVKIENGLATVQVGDRMLVAVAPSQTQGESARHVHVCIKGEDVTL
ncbi:MAG: ABC transporter ATP-binding protein, partial [Planctomycetes bacterium]|nr:ABC transporter ATP-binding protein [Planctomycetota bacterium]